MQSFVGQVKVELYDEPVLVGVEVPPVEDLDSYEGKVWLEISKS